jgi:amino acid adenylation domain-containing protein
MGYLLSHALTEAARRSPSKDAVVFQDQRLSYAALDEASNRLAHALRGQGVGRGDRVGIYVDKSIAAVVAIYGALKADAVYVPLDSQAPSKRLRYIIGDCGIRCLLTSARKLPSLRAIAAAPSPLERLVFVDDEPAANVPDGLEVTTWEAVERESAAPPVTRAIETDLAYILYTSGSTGDPKGVMISHLNALTFVNWAADTVRLDADDRVSNHAPLQFDLSVFDIFATAKAGGTLFPVPAEIARFPMDLASFIAGQRISVWYSVPSAWVLMLGRGQMEQCDFSALRTVVFAGEVFPTKHLRSLIECVPHAEYYNWYGPTETNVITSYRVVSLAPDRNEPIPIGKSCANMEVFALDGEGRVVTDAGVEGELYARGSCVALGYWNDPRRTSERFVRNPVQPFFEERAYRTGDLVKLDANGDYLFVGRRDHQVKVLGYRIELGDVETALLSHPYIEEAAVIVCNGEGSEASLRAFVVPRNGDGLEPGEVRRHCAWLLPKYMVPAVIEVREALPKTATGKTDRTRLAADVAGQGAT